MGLSRKAWFGALLFAVTVVSTQSFVYDSKTGRFCRLNTMCFEKQPTTASSTNGDNNKDDTAVVQRKTWNPLRLAVLRLGLTEPAMTSALNYGQYDNGNFFCAYCGHALFDSNAKYDSGSGWPSFWRSKDEGSVSYQREWDGRLEVQCQKCHSHLGHVFLDGPKRVDMQLLETAPKSDPRGSKPNAPLPRFCVNGAALTYRKNAQ